MCVDTFDGAHVYMACACLLYVCTYANIIIIIDNFMFTLDWLLEISPIIVTGSEKRDHFALNAIFCHFSNCHHFKVSRALGFWLGLLAVWTFYFTDPTLEA